MSFSLRLTADLVLAVSSRIFTNPHGPSPILRLSPDAFFDPGSGSFAASISHRANESSPSPARISRFRSPIVWIGGSESLDDPGVPLLANALAASGRHVFLETSGASLKSRLHEFKPSSRFYFVIRFTARSPVLRDRSSSDSSFLTGFEALRRARLAGFLVCARLISPFDAFAEVERLHAEIRNLGVDGFFLTPATLSPELAAQVARLRRRLLDRRCAMFSSLLDAGSFSPESRNSSAAELSPLPESPRDRFREGAEAG
ncbi:MAG: hypothetical protein WCE61_01770 [Candidatus Acidiferrum sp.]